MTSPLQQVKVYKGISTYILSGNIINRIENNDRLNALLDKRPTAIIERAEVWFASGWTVRHTATHHLTQPNVTVWTKMW